MFNTNTIAVNEGIKKTKSGRVNLSTPHGRLLNNGTKGGKKGFEIKVIIAVKTISEREMSKQIFTSLSLNKLVILPFVYIRVSQSVP